MHPECSADIASNKAASVLTKVRRNEALPSASAFETPARTMLDLSGTVSPAPRSTLPPPEDSPDSAGKRRQLLSLCPG